MDEKREIDSCSHGTQNALIGVLCAALVFMTIQSIILAFVYRRWNLLKQRRSNDHHSRHHGSNRSHQRNNEINMTPISNPDQNIEYATINRNENESRPEPTYNNINGTISKIKITRKKSNQPQSLAIDNQMYADPQNLANESPCDDQTNGASDPIYMNNLTPKPKIKIIKKKKIEPPQTLAIDNELYSQMDNFTKESPRSVRSPIGQAMANDMSSSKPEVPQKPKK